MKSVTTQKKPPATPAEWETLIAAAPGEDRALTPREKKKMANSVVVPGGGYTAVKGALANRRRGERGPQVAPTKQLVSVRFSPEVLQYFKSTGTGWQTRMNEVLLQWVSKHSERGRSGA